MGIEWKDGGEKPLLKPAVCFLCGKVIPGGSRDYGFGKDEGGYWVRAHADCIMPDLPPEEALEEGSTLDNVVDELICIRELLQQLVAQGAK